MVARQTLAEWEPPYQDDQELTKLSANVFAVSAGRDALDEHLEVLRLLASLSYRAEDDRTVQKTLSNTSPQNHESTTNHKTQAESKRRNE